MRGFKLGLLALAGLLLSGCGYNTFQTQDEQVKSAWSEVLNQYQRRADLIPNLVATVKGFAAQEQAVLIGVTEARAKATQSQVNVNADDPASLAQFQAVKHQLANMALEIDPTRGLWWYAAHAYDHAPADAARAAALAKSHITDRAQQVARDAVEAHGGIGFTWECDVHLWFKRIMFDRLWLGAPELHRERFAALEGWR